MRLLRREQEKEFFEYIDRQLGRALTIKEQVETGFSIKL